MHINRIYPGGRVTADNITYRQYLDGLVAADIGFVYDEENDEYDYVDSNGNGVFTFHPSNKDNYDTPLTGNAGNINVYDKDNPGASITQILGGQFNSGAIPIFDYIKFGDTLLYHTSLNTTDVFNGVWHFICPPKTEDDTWFADDQSYLYNHAAMNKSQRPYNTNFVGDGVNVTIPTACRVGKHFDPYMQRFANNLYISTLYPTMPAPCFEEVNIGNKRFLIFNIMTSPNMAAPAFDITDYIEEE
jgi:hypothetical protein